MNLKLIVGAALLLATLLFCVQNAGVVDVRFFVWKFSLSLALVVFGALAAGWLGGWAFTSALRLKHKAQQS